MCHQINQSNSERPELYLYTEKVHYLLLTYVLSVQEAVNLIKTSLLEPYFLSALFPKNVSAALICIVSELQSWIVICWAVVEVRRFILKVFMTFENLIPCLDDTGFDSV